MLEDFLEKIEQGERGFDERIWEGAPPLTSSLMNLVEKYLPEDKKEKLKDLLFGAKEKKIEPNDNLDMAYSVSEAENLAWEMIQIKKRFEFIFRMLVK